MQQGWWRVRDVAGTKATGGLPVSGLMSRVFRDTPSRSPSPPIPSPPLPSPQSPPQEGWWGVGGPPSGSQAKGPSLLRECGPLSREPLRSGSRGRGSDCFPRKVLTYSSHRRCGSNRKDDPLKFKKNQSKSVKLLFSLHFGVWGCLANLICFLCPTIIRK